MRAIAITARILIGIVFIFSGFVKAIDPLGNTYKIIDYFTAFGMSFLTPLAFTLSILQNSAEFLIGVTLILGVRMKETAWAVLLFMVFFTGLTLVIALTNPVSDCGCFGDALVLTNWQTFYKNIVLLLLALIVFLYRKKYHPAYSSTTEWTWVVGITVVIVGISIHCYRHLPMLDFRPYSIGSNIPAGMSIPEGMPTDVYRTTFLYEKDGVVKEFTEDNYPWQDTTWTWKDSKSVLLEKGYVPPIHDFSITTLDGNDITDSILSSPSYTFLMIAYRLDKADKTALAEANRLAAYCKENGYGFYCLTSTPQDIDNIKVDMTIDYEFCLADAITLKTIIRANPGFVLLKSGTVLNKWHYNDMPDARVLPSDLLSYSLKEQLQLSDSRLINGLIILFILVAFGFYHFRNERD